MLRPASIVVAMLVACGGDDDSSGDPGGGPIPADEGASLCEAFSGHAGECGWGGNVNDFDWNCGDATVVWRADAFRAFVECASDLECEGDGASCYAATLDEIEPLPVHLTFAERCGERAGECSELADRSCSAEAFELYTSAVVEELTACFDEECSAIEACLSGVL